jgi:hypothetical protein
MLVQRQLRAAEIALETARRRRFETDEVIREFRTVAERAQAALAESEAARDRDAATFRARIAALEAATLDAEQRRLVERNRRLAVDQQLSALSAEAGLRDETARQLSAETRIRQLEGELELVSRRAAEFEYGLRMAAMDAFRLVRAMADRVDAMLGRPRRADPLAPPASQRRERAPFGATAPTVASHGEAAPDPPVESLNPFEVADAVDPAFSFEPTVRWEEVASEPVRWQEAPVHFQTAPRKPHEFGAAQRLDGPPASPQAPSPSSPLWSRERPASPGPRDPASLRPLPVASVLDSQLDSHRLDAALDRLRSSAPAGDEPAHDDA